MNSEDLKLQWTVRLAAAAARRESRLGLEGSEEFEEESLNWTF